MALPWVEFHMPPLFPYTKLHKNVLRCLCISVCGYCKLSYGIICKQSDCSTYILDNIIGFSSNTMLPGARPTIIISGILIHPVVWPQQTWAENWGPVPTFWGGELGPHLAQCGLGRGLTP